MALTPLIIGAEQRALLQGLRDKAVAEPIDMPAVIELIRTREGLARHLARMADFTIDLPSIYRATFTIEAGHPAGLCRHLSVSIKRHGRMPSHEAVWMIAEELGFKVGLHACAIWTEDIGEGDHAANIVQPMHGPA